MDGAESTPEKSSSPSDITPSPKSSESFRNMAHNEFEGLHSRFGLSSRPHAESGSKLEQRNALHPYVRPLTVKDIDQCVYLESATFPANERCTREKFLYRLTKCPELSLGIFSIAPPEPADSDATKVQLPSGDRPLLPTNGEVLVAHVVATKCESDVVTDDAMGYPSDWISTSSQPSKLGHREEGRTIAVHSLAVLPAYQRLGVGSVLFKSYIQRMRESAIADRIALIAHAQCIKFYEGFGFTNKGKSDSQFGGGGWNDLALEFSKGGIHA